MPGEGAGQATRATTCQRAGTNTPRLRNGRTARKGEAEQPTCRRRGGRYGGPTAALRKGPGSCAGHQRLLHPRQRLRGGQPRFVHHQRVYERARRWGMVVLLAAAGLGHRLGSTRPWRLRLRRRRPLGARLGGTQDQGDDGQGRRIVRKRTVKGKNHSAPGRQAAFERVAIGRVVSGAWALGALAVGAGAFGALAIGALAIRALAIKKGRIERLNIGELEVGTLHVRELVVEQEQTPRQGASESTS